MNYTEVVMRKSYKELIYKIITSLFIRGLLLIIPIFWSKTINYVSDSNFHKAYYLIIIILILSVFYYVFQYLNQVTWFKLYNKLYLEYTNLTTKNNIDNIKQISLAEYTNITNNDIDIICNFIGNAVVRVIQMIEFLVIYLYFLSIDFYIFLITVIISIIMLIILLVSGNQVKKENIKRKVNLDKKTITAHEMYDSIKDNNYEMSIFSKFYKNTIEYLKSNYNFNILAQAFIYLVLGTIEVCRYSLILYSIYLVSVGRMEVGTVLLIYSYYDKIIANFEVVGTINAEYQSFVVSLKRLNKLNTEEKQKV